VGALKSALDGYLRFPTIREMHAAKAIGTTKEATVNDSGLYIGAKIVDKDAWEKVKEGVYRAFSIGGRVTKKINDTIESMQLTEISLVDVPANSQAVVTLFKSNKSSEMEILMKTAPQALTEAMKKYGVDCIECDVDAKMHEEIKDAESILSSACSLAWTRYWYESKGKPTQQLDNAIAALKALAIQLLTGEDYKKFDSIMETVGLETGYEVKHVYDFMKVQSGNSLPFTGGFMSKNETKDEVKVEETKEVEPETKEAPAAPEVAETPAVETPATPETPAPAKEAGVAENTMSKLDALATTLKGEDTKKEGEVEKFDNPQMQKMAETQKAQATQISQLEQALEKAVSVLGQVVERVSKVEATPAAPKTAHNFAVTSPIVAKSGDENPNAKRIGEIQTRLQELTKIRENDLSKFQRDHQSEANSLMDELGNL
jgi:HK97 family phage prohead protease